MLTVSIPNWTKFNPRSDRANYSWFRLENTFFSDQGVFPLTDSQKVLYLFVVCELSKKNKDQVDLRLDYISAMLNRTKKMIESDFKVLNSARLLVSERRQSDGTVPSSRPATNETNETRRNVTRQEETHAHSRPVLDFDSLYQKYPLKKGKQRGIQICQKQITSPELYAALSGAIDRYSDDVIRTATEARFIKHFSTFMASWRDWLDSDVGTSTLPLASDPFAFLKDQAS